MRADPSNEENNHMHTTYPETAERIYRPAEEATRRVVSTTRSATIIATAMQKGGVGKTTTTLALGSELARSGARVLLVDLDPQGNLTQGLGVSPGSFTETIYEAMIDPRAAGAATIQTDHGVNLLPATLDLAGAELSFAGMFGREMKLRAALDPLRQLYDYMLIDSPPSLGLFTVNALVAADTILIPLQAHVFALQAMTQIESTIAMVRQLNPQLTIGGIVMTMTDKRTNVSGLIEAQARERYGDLVFHTTIPLNTKVVEAPAAGQPITIYAPDSSGARAYQALAEEVRERWGVR
jgi:chromosome partitioning protein